MSPIGAPLTLAADPVGAASAKSLRAEATKAERKESLEAKKTREAALQFEQIMIRQLLEPLEKSLSKSFGGGSNSPMIGGMIMSSLSQSITDGGGLGLASVIEEALRTAPSAPVSVGAGSEQQPQTAAGEET